MVILPLLNFEKSDFGPPRQFIHPSPAPGKPRSQSILADLCRCLLSLPLLNSQQWKILYSLTNFGQWSFFVPWDKHSVDIRRKEDSPHGTNCCKIRIYEKHETWIHENIAIDFARWVSERLQTFISPYQQRAPNRTSAFGLIGTLDIVYFPF